MPTTTSEERVASDSATAVWYGIVAASASCSSHYGLAVPVKNLHWQNIITYHILYEATEGVKVDGAHTSTCSTFSYESQPSHPGQVPVRSLISVNTNC